LGIGIDEDVMPFLTEEVGGCSDPQFSHLTVQNVMDIIPNKDPESDPPLPYISMFGWS
jgi:hypothetical protein